MIATAHWLHKGTQLFFFLFFVPQMGSNVFEEDTENIERKGTLKEKDGRQFSLNKNKGFAIAKQMRIIVAETQSVTFIFSFFNVGIINWGDDNQERNEIIITWRIDSKQFWRKETSRLMAFLSQESTTTTNYYRWINTWAKGSTRQ